MYSTRLLEEEQGKVVYRQQRDQYNCYWANVICTSNREKKINDGIVCVILLSVKCARWQDAKQNFFLQDKLLNKNEILIEA